MQAVERQGFAVLDGDGDLVTPLVGDAECAYSYRAYNIDGQQITGRGEAAGEQPYITLCAVERAYNEGKTPFRKPISCHLYPIRVKRFGDGSLGLQYHRWAVCECARRLGEQQGVPMFRMLREAIVRRFGEDFYAALEAAEGYINDNL